MNNYSDMQETTILANFKQLCIEPVVARTHNSTFAKGRVSFFADSYVVKESLVLRMNICAEQPPIANLQTVSIMDMIMVSPSFDGQ